MVLCMAKIELLNYIQPKDRLSKIRIAYNRLKSKIPEGNAQHEIEKDLKRLESIPRSLVASSSQFTEIFDRLKIKFIRLDDPESD